MNVISFPPQQTIKLPSNEQVKDLFTDIIKDNDSKKLRWGDTLVVRLLSRDLTIRHICEVIYKGTIEENSQRIDRYGSIRITIIRTCGGRRTKVIVALAKDYLIVVDAT